MVRQTTTSRPKIAILGCGFMGTAMLKGWLKDESATSRSYTAHVRTLSSKERLRHELGEDAEQVCITYGDDQLVEAASGAHIAVLGVHPGEMDTLLGVPGLTKELESSIIVSMLAGVSTAQLRDSLNGAKRNDTKDHGWRVARIIPTLAAIICESVTLLAQDSALEAPEHIQIVEKALLPLGTVQRIPERLMNEATAVGAAIHALTITAVESATDASVADGVPRSVALALAAQCMRSCSGLMLDGGMSPEQVKAAMSTPGGITINSIVKLDETVRSGIAGTVRNSIAHTRKMAG